MDHAINTKAAFQSCLTCAKNHYENFPVASWLLPKQLHHPIAAIYTFARNADDFADEGDLDIAQRLSLLDAYDEQLNRIEQGHSSDDPVFIALKHTIGTYDLPIEQFRKLLSAFRQDIVKTRYTNIADVYDYCDRSANPIGFLLLCLFRKATDKNMGYSNNICTSLQIINFLQDISIDYKKGRIYLPQDEMLRCGITEKYMADKIFDSNWKIFMTQQLDRAEQLLTDGAPLGRVLPGRMGLEIRITVLGGLAIIKKLRKQNQHQFSTQPRLGTIDWVKMFAGMLYYPYP